MPFQNVALQIAGRWARKVSSPIEIPYRQTRDINGGSREQAAAAAESMIIMAARAARPEIVL